jgi:hypothetical protein
VILNSYLADKKDDIKAYSQMLDFIERENIEVDSAMKQLCRSRRIRSHKSPLHTFNKDYKGSTYNVLVGETTYEPLDLITKYSLIACAEYAKKWVCLIRLFGANGQSDQALLPQTRTILENLAIWFSEPKLKLLQLIGPMGTKIGGTLKP